MTFVITNIILLIILLVVVSWLTWRTAELSAIRRIRTRFHNHIGAMRKRVKNLSIDDFEFEVNDVLKSEEKKAKK